jgi:hypothetical protein
MTEREQLRYIENRFYVYNRAGGRCEACGEAIGISSFQMAHRIPQTKYFVKKFGKGVIHHRDNFAATCSLGCNSSMDIRNHPVEVAELAEAIQEKIDAGEE